MAESQHPTNNSGLIERSTPNVPEHPKKHEERADELRVPQPERAQSALLIAQRSGAMEAEKAGEKETQQQRSREPML